MQKMVADLVGDIFHPLLCDSVADSVRDVYPQNPCLGEHAPVPGGSAVSET